jgi:predicted SAM-dependent methyltransferase
MRYVQYGAGRDVPDEWINFDSSPTLRFEKIPLVGQLYTKNAKRFPKGLRYGDIVKGLPIKDKSCDGVYCSHVLEHLSYNDCLKALAESYRILRPGGIFRLILPDLEILSDDYLQRCKSSDAGAAYDFMKQSHLGVLNRFRTFSAFITEWLGSSKHLWMWDYLSLAEQLQKAGFQDIRRAKFNDCEDEMFKQVENPARFEKACAIQARRPLD